MISYIAIAQQLCADIDSLFYFLVLKYKKKARATNHHINIVRPCNSANYHKCKRGSNSYFVNGLDLIEHNNNLTLEPNLGTDNSFLKYYKQIFHRARWNLTNLDTINQHNMRRGPLTFFNKKEETRVQNSSLDGLKHQIVTLSLI